MKKIPVLEWFFHGPALGPSMFLAGTVLAVMILPTIVALVAHVACRQWRSRTARRRGRSGATRWQVVTTAVVPGARTGIEAAVTLGIGRAMGETIAVAMVIGNNYALPHSLLSPGATLGSAIINNFGEASPGLDRASVIGLVVVLLVHLRPRQRRGAAPVADSVAIGRGHDVSSTVFALEPDAAGAIGARRDLVRESARRSLVRRRLLGRVAIGLCVVAVAISLAPLVALVAYTTSRGIHALSWAFLTHVPTPPGIPGGGISNAIVGSVIIVGVAVVMAVPVGIMAALFLVERSGRIASALRFAADVLTGVPSIAVGAFAVAVFVDPFDHYSGLVGSFALADAHAAHRDPRQRGRHAIRTPRPVGGGPRPRGAALARGALRGPARRSPRTRDRQSPGRVARRGRDRAAVVHDLRELSSSWPTRRSRCRRCR